MKVCVIEHVSVVHVVLTVVKYTNIVCIDTNYVFDLIATGSGADHDPICSRYECRRGTKVLMFLYLVPVSILEGVTCLHGEGEL